MNQTLKVAKKVVRSPGYRRAKFFISVLVWLALITAVLLAMSQGG
ncbi:MAG: hypothetical protein AB3N12_01425 [Ruegeria sp.]